jgi:enoyl-CoA hydratase
MASPKNILTKKDNDILEIRINRPDKLNALNNQTLEEIGQAVQGAYDDAEVKGIIITGAGDKAFAAGADIREFRELSALNARKFSENGQEIFDVIENCHKPVIAVVNGYALGGGCELAMACHIRIATENARFGQPEVSLGLIPAFGGTQRLTQLVGKGIALEMMLSGETITASRAHNVGLVNYVLPDSAAAFEKAEELLAKIFKNAPIAVGMVINCANIVFSGQENGYQTEANGFASCAKSADFQEGVAAFLEKRLPDFKGE